MARWVCAGRRRGKGSHLQRASSCACTPAAKKACPLFQLKLRTHVHVALPSHPVHHLRARAALAALHIRLIQQHHRHVNGEGGASRLQPPLMVGLLTPWLQQAAECWRGEDAGASAWGQGVRSSAGR